MAERFYSVQPADDGGTAATTALYMNYNFAPQQQFLAPANVAVGTTGIGFGGLATAEFDFLTPTHAPSSLFYTTAGAGAVAYDLNNNNPNGPTYYSLAQQQQHQQQQQNSIAASYNSKIIRTGSSGNAGGSGLMSKFFNGSAGGAGAAGGYLHPASVLLTAATPTSVSALPMLAQEPTSVANTSGCHYAVANGTASCYTRNRYMPYSHSRACAAAAVHFQQQHAAAATALATYGYPPATQAIPQGVITYSAPGQRGVPTSGSCEALSSNSVASTTATPSFLSSTTMDANVPAYVPLSAATEYAYMPTVASAPIVSSCSGSTQLKASSCSSTLKTTSSATSSSAAGSAQTSGGLIASTPYSSGSTYDGTYATVKDPSQVVTLQITNLDGSMDEVSLRNFLLGQLKPITPVVGLVFEGNSYAKVTVPDIYFAKLVVSYLHRKKIGHKRMLVSYTRDSSLTEINTLRCQVAGLLKDVPYYTLPMYKFRELFQSRFKTSISILDLYKMPDVCSITADTNEEKFISLQSELVNTLESSPLMEGLQHSVPYCTIHFKRAQHKGWAEQEIEPLPNVRMSITQIQKIIYPLLKNHPGDIPIASLVHCIEGALSVLVEPDESGVNLEHLICCVQGVQIQVNNFGIKILGWLELNKEMAMYGGAGDRNGSTNSLGTPSTGAGSCLYPKNGAIADSLYLISREVIELVKMSPKATMKFNRFIPAYHNHFGKQCRVADYGYTKLIELFEALSTVVQIMGDGENRQITLTHRTQMRRFTADLLRVLRSNSNKAVLLSQLPHIFGQSHSRQFEVTDYGVCDVSDLLDGLVYSNVIVVSSVPNSTDVLISMPKRRQTSTEIEKTSVFAGEMVELFSTAPQYAILFQKFVRSYHYHFAYQCRLSDYGFLKLADLMEAIQGVVELELTNDEDRKIFLSPIVARRVFAEQCEELIRSATGTSRSCMALTEVMELHKNKFGYQMQAQTLGTARLEEALELLPYVEVVQTTSSDSSQTDAAASKSPSADVSSTESEADSTSGITPSLICHSEDVIFRTQCYRACKYLHNYKSTPSPGSSKSKETTPVSAAENKKTGKSSATSAARKETSKETAENTKPSESTKRSRKSQTPPTTTTPSAPSVVLATFLAEFNDNFKENMCLQTLKAMRHAIEIFTDDATGAQCVRLTAFSKFLIKMVRTLEQRSTVIGSMSLLDLKHALDCNLTSTYDFGYPNMFAVLSAYPDLFTLNLGVSQERCEVSLSPNCELRNSSSSTGQKTSNPAGAPAVHIPLRLASAGYTKAKPPRPSARQPLGEHNGQRVAATAASATAAGGNQSSLGVGGPPPAKTRAIAYEAMYAPSTTYGCRGQLPPPGLTACNTPGTVYYHTQQAQLALAGKVPTTAVYGGTGGKHLTAATRAGGGGGGGEGAVGGVISLLNSSSSKASQHSNSGGGANNSLLNTSNCSNSNKENSFNSSLNFFNSSFNNSSSRNSSMIELNSSFNLQQQQQQQSQLAANGSLSSNTKLWERRLAAGNFAHQQQQGQPCYQQLPLQQQQQLQPLQPIYQPSMATVNGQLAPLLMANGTTTTAATAQAAYAMGNGLEAPSICMTDSQITGQLGLYELVNNMQMCPTYQPPKPDTPPSENTPFWIDPIWTHNNRRLEQQTRDDLLNIKLPEMRTAGMLPEMLLSPYTLSKTENMKQQLFNYDGHDRKIA